MVFESIRIDYSKAYCILSAFLSGFACLRPMSIGRGRGKEMLLKLDQPYPVSVGISVSLYSQTEHDLNRPQILL